MQANYIMQKYAAIGELCAWTPALGVPPQTVYNSPLTVSVSAVSCVLMGLIIGCSEYMTLSSA